MHFKKLGYPPLDETELLKNSRLTGYDGYGVHPFYDNRSSSPWKNSRYGGYPPHHLQNGRYYGGHPWNSIVVPESFLGGQSPSKFLDEMPKNRTNIDPEVEGYQDYKHKGKYDLEEKTKKLKNTNSPFPTIASV